MSPLPPPGPNMEGTGVEGGALVLSSWGASGRSSTSQEQVATEGGPAGQCVGSGQGLGSRGAVYAAPRGRASGCCGEGLRGSPGRPVRGSETPPPERPSKWGLREAGGPALLPPPSLHQAEQPPEGRELGACRALGPASPCPSPAAPSPHHPQPLQRLPGSLHSYPH